MQVAGLHNFEAGIAVQTFPTNMKVWRKRTAKRKIAMPCGMTIFKQIGY